MRYLVCIRFCMPLIFCATTVAHAQSVNYIDESGTVHFAESPYDVPMRYRDQVIKKKPVVLDKKQLKAAEKEFKNQQQEALRQKKIQEKNAQKLAKEKAKQQEKAKSDAELAAKKREAELAKEAAALKPKTKRSKRYRDATPPNPLEDSDTNALR